MPLLEFSDLSDDAKAVLGSHFGMLNKRLTFQTPWNRTTRGATALDELVAAQMLTLDVGVDGLFAWTYRPLVDCTQAFRWMLRNSKRFAGFSMMVPDAERHERPPAGWTTPALPA